MHVLSASRASEGFVSAEREPEELFRTNFGLAIIATTNYCAKNDESSRMRLCERPVDVLDPRSH